jgi:hypothetical protein
MNLGAMDHGSIFDCHRISIALAFAALGCVVCSATVSAQAPPPPAAAAAVQSDPASADAPESELANEARPMPKTIGGGPEPVRGEYYTSPLKKFGSDFFLGSYILSAVVSAIYLAFVYPVQALSGHSKVEPVMLWLFVPIAGPLFAQTRASVESKPFWRVVLIGDAALQASGLVLGLIGTALSGRRSLEPRATSRIDVRLGVAGAGLAGVTLSVHTL